MLMYSFKISSHKEDSIEVIDDFQYREYFYDSIDKTLVDDYNIFDIINFLKLYSIDNNRLKDIIKNDKSRIYIEIDIYDEFSDKRSVDLRKKLNDTYNNDLFGVNLKHIISEYGADGLWCHRYIYDYNTNTVCSIKKIYKSACFDSIIYYHELNLKGE